MKNIFFIVAFVVNSIVTAQIIDFDNFLKENVTKDGVVNYSKMHKNHKLLNDFIAYLSNMKPKSNWSENKTKAFWINVYNANTLKIILQNYPLKSIRSIRKNDKDVWDIGFINVGDKIYTLNDIEHKILRKQFNDPRIHVGVNCASYSCPKLVNFAFTEENLDEELEHLMKQFVNDKKRNKISSNKLQLSKIFQWYAKDFMKKGSLIDYLNIYSNRKIDKKAKIEYLNYNWNLNGK